MGDSRHLEIGLSRGCLWSYVTAILRRTSTDLFLYARGAPFRHIDPSGTCSRTLVSINVDIDRWYVPAGPHRSCPPCGSPELEEHGVVTDCQFIASSRELYSYAAGFTEYSVSEDELPSCSCETRGTQVQSKTISSVYEEEEVWYLLCNYTFTRWNENLGEFETAPFFIQFEYSRIWQTYETEFVDKTWDCSCDPCECSQG